MDNMKCFIIGGPGIARETFFKWLKEEKCNEKDCGWLKKVLPYFKVVKTSSIHKAALDEVLTDPAVQDSMTDTKAIEQAKKLDDFFTVIRLNSQKAVYGYTEVKLAHSMSAIKDLLVTDQLFRSTNFKARKKMIRLIDEVKAHGGKVYFFSNMHASGMKLQELTGIAGILRYAIDIDNMEDDLARIEEEER